MSARIQREADAADGWVLAGGQSRRMGVDKAGVLLAGRPLLAHMLAKLEALGLRTRIAGDPLSSSAEGLPERFPDQRAGCGPMAGLATALERSQSALVLILGIDLPLVSTPMLARLLERARVTGALATIPRAGGRPQPLCAVYRKELSTAVSRLLAEDVFKMIHGVARAAAETGGLVDSFDVEALIASGSLRTARPAVWEFLNCNTPSDLALAERLLAQRT